MKKYILPILFISLLYWSCSEEGNPVTNNYYNGDTTIVHDTTIIYDTTIIIGDTNTTEWGFDPLICGTELTFIEYGYEPPVYQTWAVSKIENGQYVRCDENIDNISCLSYMDNYFCTDTIMYTAGVLRFFETGFLYNYNSDSCVDSFNVSWKTRDGIIAFEIIDTNQTTEVFDYFFNNVDYNYSVSINNQTLILENHISRITLVR